MSNLAIRPIGIDTQRLTASPVNTRSSTQEEIKQIDERFLRSSLTQIDDEENTESQTTKAGKAQGYGVLRLLNEGHFKGVADVRLRINFFDQLAAQQEQQSLSNLNEQTTKFAGSINDLFNESVSTLSDDEQTQASLTNQFNDFQTSLQDTLSGISIRALDPAALETSIQTSFDSFVEQLSQSLAVPDAESTSNPEVVDDQSINTSALVSNTRLDQAAVTSTSTVDQTSDLTSVDTTTVESITVVPTTTDEDALSLFKDAFAQALTEFISSLETTNTTQELSPYRGNGVAYDKFLTIYNNLSGASSTVDETI